VKETCTTCTTINYTLIVSTFDCVSVAVSLVLDSLFIHSVVMCD